MGVSGEKIRRPAAVIGTLINLRTRAADRVPIAVATALYANELWPVAPALGVDRAGRSCWPPCRSVVYGLWGSSFSRPKLQGAEAMVRRSPCRSFPFIGGRQP